MAKTKKIRTREITFEGKNIHYSPLDNKPLCSFSNKLCRQRRLNGYAFCIRHILEDKSSPFKQCDYVTRNNGQRCLNAIPSNQERGYCHSHMQVAGIIPRTERKIKPSNHGSISGNGKNSDSKKENKKSASASVQNNNQNCPAISTKAAPATTNSQVENPSLSTKSKGKSSCSQISNTTKPGNVASAGKVSDAEKTISNNVMKTGSFELQKNGSIAKKTAKPKQVKPLLGQLANQVKKQLDKTNAAKLDIPNAYLDPKLHQLKTFNLSDFPLDHSSFDAKLMKIERSHFDIPLIPRLEGVDDFCLIPPLLQLHKNTCIAKSVNGRGGFEARQEFLSSVRSAFKAHCTKFRRAYKLGQIQDEGNKSIVETLMCSALSESKISAKLLRNPQIDIASNTESKLENRNGDKSFCTAVNSFSNNSKTVANNKIAAPIQFNGGIKYINPNLLRDFDENFVLDQVKDDRICGDSSPWMNGGMNDYEMAIGKKGRNTNFSNKQFAHYTDGQTSNVSTQILNASSSLINSAYGFTDRTRSISNHLPNLFQGSPPVVTDGEIESHVMKKRRLDLDNDFDELEHNLCLDLHGSPEDENQLLCPSHYSSVAHFETVLNSVSSSDTAGTPEGVITDASFDSPFDHSTSSHPDCDFSDDVDDLEKTFELQIDPEIAHQASRLLENNELTEDDFNELFPETRSLSDHKLGGDLGIDFDADIDYSLFANIFPNFRSNNPSEAISVAQSF